MLLLATEDAIEVYAISAERRLTLLRTEPVQADGIAMTPGRS